MLNDKPITTEFKVIGRDEVVLTGRYSQKSLTGCQTAMPVRELEFTPTGGFSVTFTPFETYKDYWGSYTFDPVTKAFTAKVVGGNFVPPGLDLEGQADRVGGALTLTGVFLGDRGGYPPQEGCTYEF